MQDLSDRTLLIATYVIPASFSLGPISIHAFGGVSPWPLLYVSLLPMQALMLIAVFHKMFQVT